MGGLVLSVLPVTSGTPSLRLAQHLRGKAVQQRALGRGLSAKRAYARTVKTRISVDGSLDVTDGEAGMDTKGLEAKQKTKLEGLDDPVKLTANTVSQAGVADACDDVSIYKYLSLPVEQYTSDVLAGGEISRLSGDVFLLSVPKLEFMDVWVKPQITVVVEPPGSSKVVRLQALDCSLTGSPVIESMDLSNRVVVQMETTLEYLEDSRTLQATADLQVWTEVISPFNILPRAVIVGTSNTVVQTLMNAMLGIFVSKVAKDYLRWSTDAEYRAKRQEMMD